MTAFRAPGRKGSHSVLVHRAVRGISRLTPCRSRAPAPVPGRVIPWLICDPAAPVGSGGVMRDQPKNARLMSAPRA
jgi:hypothetical protein